MTNLDRKNKDIVLCWLPSHIGIEGNEEADRAAKRALKMPPGMTKIPYTDMIAPLQEFINKNWQSDWNKEVGNKLHTISLQ